MRGPAAIKLIITITKESTQIPKSKIIVDKLTRVSYILWVKRELGKICCDDKIGKAM